MRTPAIFGLLVIGLVLTASAAMAFGYGREGETRTAIQDAIATGDYDAWKEAVSADLTQERFDQLVAHRQARGQHDETRAAMQAAIEAGDYEAWKAAAESVEDCPRDVQTLTEEEFGLLVQMHEARMSGDYEEAQALADELGLPRPGMGGHRGQGGKGMGMWG
jgi:hypothetical protein